MSRGPGKIERAIEAVFVSDPDDAYTVEDLIDRVYSGINRVEKKHRVSLIRAAKKVCVRLNWNWYTAGSRGGTLVFFSCYNVMSYASAKLKAAYGFNHYRSKDPRIPDHWRGTPESIRSSLQPGGKKHHWVAEGGAWWRHVQLNIADRDGDTSERIQILRAEQDKANRIADAIMRKPL